MPLTLMSGQGQQSGWFFCFKVVKTIVLLFLLYNVHYSLGLVYAVLLLVDIAKVEKRWSSSEYLQILATHLQQGVSQKLLYVIP